MGVLSSISRVLLQGEKMIRVVVLEVAGAQGPPVPPPLRSRETLEVLGWKAKKDNEWVCSLRSAFLHSNHLRVLHRHASK